MAENVYEGMFILDSNRYSRDAAGVSGQIATMIQNHNGEVLVSRLWEERRLAYPIKGHRKGAYWLTYFRVEGSAVAKIEREAQLNENIIRALITKIDPRLVDTLVAHALSGTAGDGGRPRHETPAEPVAAAAVAAEGEAEETEE